MTDNTHLTDLIARIRGGDQKAIAELLGPYKEEVKTAIRQRLNAGNKLRRQLDSSDVLQSIVFQVHRNAEKAQAEIKDGAAFFGSMARNRVVDHARKQATQKRDSHKEEELREIADPAPSVLDGMIRQEQWDAILNALSPSERGIAERRAAGAQWAEIAGDTGENPETIAKRFHRRMQMLGNPLLGE